MVACGRGIMWASGRSAVWPQVLAIALMGLVAAGCTDASRFSDFDSDRPRGDVVGSAPPPSGRIESRPLPRVSSNDGFSGGARGMESYRPGSSGEVTGSLPPSAPPPPPPPRFTWEGGTAITVGCGETTHS